MKIQDLYKGMLKYNSGKDDRGWEMKKNLVWGCRIESQLIWDRQYHRSSKQPLTKTQKNPIDKNAVTSAGPIAQVSDQNTHEWLIQLLTLFCASVAVMSVALNDQVNTQGYYCGLGTAPD